VTIDEGLEFKVQNTSHKLNNSVKKTSAFKSFFASKFHHNTQQINIMETNRLTS
jgi:hypothetical protein